MSSCGKSRLFIPIKLLIAQQREFTIARIKVAARRTSSNDHRFAQSIQFCACNRRDDAPEYNTGDKFMPSFFFLRDDVTFISDFNDWFGRVTRPHSLYCISSAKKAIELMYQRMIEKCTSTPHVKRLRIFINAIIRHRYSWVISLGITHNCLSVFK